MNDLQMKLLPEAIVVEKILDDDDSEEIDDCSIDPVWVTNDRHVLCVSGKMTIKSGKLSDKQVLMA